MNRIILGENSKVIPDLPKCSCSLIYIDPPFNSGKVQYRDVVSVARAGGVGDRIGFGDKRYKVLSSHMNVGSFNDSFNDYEHWLVSRIEAAIDCLTDNGSLIVHQDCWEVHYIKVALDKLFGSRDHFINEIIRSYDYGGKSRKRWPRGHENLLWYAVNPRDFIFNHDDIDRVPYMAPKLVGPVKAAAGKVPTDSWWYSIEGTKGHEWTDNQYATQKPVKLLERIVKVHSMPGDTVLDFFAGSGTTGAAAARHGRDFILVDNNPNAIRIARNRLSKYNPTNTDYSLD